MAFLVSGLPREVILYMYISQICIDRHSYNCKVKRSLLVLFYNHSKERKPYQRLLCALLILLLIQDNGSFPLCHLDQLSPGFFLIVSGSLSLMLGIQTCLGKLTLSLVCLQ